MVLAQMFAKDAGSVEAFLADLRELVNPDEDKEPVEIDEAGETEEEHGEDSDLAGSVAEQGEVEAEIELHTPTVQRPVLDVFSTPIMGGKAIERSTRRKEIRATQSDLDWRGQILCDLEVHYPFEVNAVYLALEDRQGVRYQWLDQRTTHKGFELFVITSIE